MRLGRQHGARCTADYLKLAVGRTAMKNTDAVFVRRRTGAKDTEPVNGLFSTDFDAVFGRAVGLVETNRSAVKTRRKYFEKRVNHAKI